ncbi:hypothetical protein [Kitasatospora sp. NPDC004531]
MFSFPREFREGCDANAVAVEALVRPSLTLVEAIAATMARVRRHTVEFLAATAALRSAAARLAPGEPRSGIEEFTHGVQDVLRATWLWQLRSPRYRETRAVFR